MPARILISAGEPSGDRHAADLVRALQVRWPHAEFWGMGGPELERAGVHLIHRFSEKDALIGLEGVLSGLRRFRHRLKTLVTFARRQRVNLAILVDFPGFHLFLARALHRQQIPVVYYILPQTWAWGTWRHRLLRTTTDLRLSILPFEPSWFQAFGIEVIYVGHPLRDRLPDPPARNTPSHPPIIGFFPGSRPGEIRRHLPIFQALRQSLEKHLKARFWLSQAPGIQLETYGPISGFVLQTQPPWQWIHKLDFAIAASGTITLELALLGVPTVVLYQTSRMTVWVGRRLVRVPWLSLPNLLTGEPLMPEYIQTLPLEEVVSWILDLWRDASAYIRFRTRLLSLRDLLGPPGAATRAAEEIVRFLDRGYAHVPERRIPAIRANQGTL